MQSRDLKAAIANSIKTFRKKNRISQEEFSAMCGLHRTYVGAVERRERNLTLGTLELIASAMKCDVVEILKSKG
jgi:transcriptional regulator with XRE-family HTH domain